MMRLVLASMVLLAGGWATMAGANASGGKEYVIDKGGLRVVFTEMDGKVTLTSLSGPGGTEWLVKNGGNPDLWRLTVEGPDGESREIRSSEMPLRTGQRGWTLQWGMSMGGKAPEPPEDARVNLEVLPDSEGKPLAEWRLAVWLPKGWSVARCDFPIIDNIAPRDDLKLAAPFGWGLEYDVKPGMGYGGTYPSCQAAMQFVALYRGGSGLYIGQNDPEGEHKHLEVKAREDGVGFTCTNWPSGDGGASYKAVIGTFQGDYYDAARIYRDFTFSAPWGKGKPLSKRSVPQWLKDTDLWLMPSAEPLKNVEECKKARDYFGVPTALHWYNWHQIPFDTLYPDYFPAKEHFAEGGKALQDLGFHVMPYINGRLCDPNSKAWKEEGADKAACRQENGEPYTEVYGSKVPLNVMCPWTEYWQDKITGLVDKLVNECGVDGVYIDQIGAAAPVRCFDSDHGHAIGGGHFWMDGYRKMLEKVRSKLRPGAMITTEEDGECWNDQLDALLLVNTATTDAARPIPLFPAVYAGRELSFGFQYIAGDDIAKSIPWRFKMARAFAWGSQLGWVGVERIMAPDAVKEAEFLRNLARCRRFAHPFVVTGDFLGMLDVRGDNPRLKCDATRSFGGGTYKIDTPAVIGSAWLADDGSIGVLLANMSDEAREVEVTLPLAKAGIDPFAGYTVKTSGPEGLVSAEKAASVVRKVTVGPRSAVVLAVSR